MQNPLDMAFENRTIVLIENDNTFEQVMLNKEQYKRLTALIGVRNRSAEQDLRPGFHMYHVPINDEITVPTDSLIGAQSIYPQEVIDEAMHNPED